MKHFKDINHLKVLVVNAEEGYNIDQNSTVEEILACEGCIIYDLGRYFQDQNDEELGSHWSFMVNIETKEEFTGMYNDQL